MVNDDEAIEAACKEFFAIYATLHTSAVAMRRAINVYLDMTKGETNAD